MHSNAHHHISLFGTNWSSATAALTITLTLLLLIFLFLFLALIASPLQVQAFGNMYTCAGYRVALLAV